MKTGFIGLGAMGISMARNLAKQGFLAAIWNRSQGVAAEVAQELRVVRARTPADLAQQVDILLTCVSADSDVIDVIEQVLPGLDKGKVVVDTSTISSETAKQVARILSEKAVHFLDAPVSGGTEGAKNGTLAMMIGGNEEVLEQVRPVLNALTSRIMRMGDVGTGQGTKAVNQIMAAGINQAVTEALTFGEAQGLAMEKVIEVISGGAAGNWFLNHRGSTMTQGKFAPGFKVALHHKDLMICKESARNRNMALPLVEMTLDHYKTLIKDGYGNDDISALYRIKKP